MGKPIDHWVNGLEINFNDAKKISKPKATTHFKFNHKTNLPVNPTVQMVMPAPEEEAGIEDITPL